MPSPLAPLADKGVRITGSLVRTAILVCVLVSTGVVLDRVIASRDQRLATLEAQNVSQNNDLMVKTAQLQRLEARYGKISDRLCRIGLALHIDRVEVCDRGDP